MLSRKERGLTLIEMILTLTILALAGSIIYGSFNTALRTWRIGFARGREELVVRIVMARLAEQLRSAVAAPARKGNEEAVAFDAREDSLRFVTVQSTAGPAPTQVSYSLGDHEGKRALLYREFPWPDKDFFGEGKPSREEIVPEVSGLKVTVAKRVEADQTQTPEQETEQAWKPTDGVLPGTVEIRIAVKPEGGEETSFLLKVPLAVESR